VRSRLGDLTRVDPVPGEVVQDSAAASPGSVSRAPQIAPLLSTSTPVFLARHGETESNRLRRYAGYSPEPLTELGRAQMSALAAQLGLVGIHEVWTSEVARACESAELIARVLGIPVRTDARLNELRMGPWEGLTEQDVADRFPEAHALWCTLPDRVVLEGRETLDVLATRVTEAVSEAARQSRPVLLLTHVAPFRVAVLSALGLPLRLYKRLHVSNAECVYVDQARRDARHLGEDRSLRPRLELSLAGPESSVA